MACNTNLTESRPSAHRVVLLGDSGVGKTSLFYLIKDGFFRETGSSTTQIAEFDKPIQTGQGEVMLQFVDTCGFETYHNSIPPSMMRNASVVLFVFALDDNASFLHLKHWYEETFDATPEYLMSKIHKIMVGNKSDLARKVHPKQVEDLCSEQYGIAKDRIFDVSAKDNTDVDKLLQAIAQSLSPIKKSDKKVAPPPPINSSVRFCRFF